MEPMYATTQALSESPDFDIAPHQSLLVAEG